MKGKLLLLLTGLAAAALAAGCGPGPEYDMQVEWAAHATEAISQPELVTWWGSHPVGDFKKADVGVAVPETAKEVEKVTLYVPAGYGLNPAASPGTAEGRFFVGTQPDYGIFTLTAVDPKLWENTPQAQACAPGQHAGVWVAQVSDASDGLKSMAPVAFYVDPTSGPDTGLGDYELQACLPLAHLSSPGGAPIGSRVCYFLVSFAGLTAPATPQLGVWRAYVSNPDSAGMPDPATTYELRSDQPLPASLGLTAKVDRKHHRAVLRGQLVASAISVAGVKVTLYRLGDGKAVATTHTLPDGTYRFSQPARRTKWYQAEAGGSGAACVDASTAPAGCVRETLGYVDSLRVRAVAPRHRR